ncbi:hypothetical protein DFH28DRAFT_1102505 [Melampsora americana]|nr:hypothetical protein DFH28DRAFT_1102505 [Melampsora americana]
MQTFLSFSIVAVLLVFQARLWQAQQPTVNRWVKRDIPVESIQKAYDFARDDNGVYKEVDEIGRSMSLPGSSADVKSMMGLRLFDGPSPEVPGMAPGGGGIYDHGPSTSTSGASQSSSTHNKGHSTINEHVTDHQDVSKYDPNLDLAGWYQDGKMSTFGIDGSYQGVYTRALAEIFDVMGDKKTWSLERRYKFWRALSSLQAFDELQFKKSLALITKHLGIDETEYRYHLLKDGHVDFHAWILAFFQHQVIGTKSNFISTSAYKKISSYKPGEALLIHNYLRKHFQRSSFNALQYLRGEFALKNLESRLKSREELLELGRIEESLNLAVEKGKETSTLELMDAISAQERFAKREGLPRRLNEDLVQKINSNIIKLKAMLPQWLTHDLRISRRAIKRFDENKEFLRRKKEIDAAAEILMAPGYVGDTKFLAWITMQPAKKDPDPRVSGIGNGLGGRNSFSRSDKYAHPSFDQLAKIQERMKIVKSFKPEIIDRASLENHRAIKRAEYHTMLVNRWKTHQEVIIKKFFESPDEGDQLLQMIRFGSFLKFHEVFPTFSSSTKSDLEEMIKSFVRLSQEKKDELENLLGKESMEGEESKGINDYIKNAGARLRFATSQDGQALKRWKDDEPKSWLYYGMEFEMLTKFTDYLKVGSKSGTDPTEKIPAKALLAWKGSAEEEWMNEALGKISRGEGPYGIKARPKKFDGLEKDVKSQTESKVDDLDSSSRLLTRSKTDLKRLSSWRSFQWKKGSNLPSNTKSN